MPKVSLILYKEGEKIARHTEVLIAQDSGNQSLVQGKFAQIAPPRQTISGEWRVCILYNDRSWRSALDRAMQLTLSARRIAP
jgi:hypothetical protein